MYRLNKSLLYILILTIVSSFLAYRIIVKAYDGVYIDSHYEVLIIKAK